MNLPSLTRRLQAQLTPRQMQLLRAAGEFADRRGLGLFLAGGAVRDVMLGLPVRDLDLVTEGDGVAWAKAWAVDLQAAVQAHPRFGTAALHLPDGMLLDVATARTESYAHPAALPIVTPALDIDADLGRRDFTLNAMAVCLNPGRFGALHDKFGGRRDLADGLIRILHSRSFHDDPTRIFRAVRYAGRYGFRLERRTREALREALALKVAARLTPARIAKELQLVHLEAKHSEILKRLAFWGLPVM